MVEASFDNWTSIFLFAAVQGAFLAIALCLVRKGRRLSNIILSFLMLTFSLVLAYYVAFWTGYNRVYPQMEGWTNALPFLFGPLIYLYTSSLLSKSLSKSSLFHFTPFLLHFLYLIPFLLLSGQEKIQFFANMESLPVWRLWAGRTIVWAQVMQMIVYAVLAIMLVFRESREMDFARKLSRRTFIGRLSILFLVFSLIHASYYVMVFIGQYERLVDYGMALGMSVLIYFVGYSGFRVPYALINVDGRKDKSGNSNLTPLATQTFLSKLRSHMESERPYLDGDLKLADLASQLGMKAHDLSKLINDQFGHSYSDFINSYRIKEAEKLLMKSDDSDVRVIEIAYHSGFNTKAAFYNAFKKKNGISPLSFRKAYIRSMKDQPAMQGVIG